MGSSWPLYFLAPVAGTLLPIRYSTPSAPPCARRQGSQAFTPAQPRTLSPKFLAGRHHLTFYVECGGGFTLLRQGGSGEAHVSRISGDAVVALSSENRSMTSLAIGRRPLPRQPSGRLARRPVPLSRGQASAAPTAGRPGVGGSRQREVEAERATSRRTEGRARRGGQASLVGLPSVIEAHSFLPVRGARGSPRHVVAVEAQIQISRVCSRVAW